VSRPNEIGIAEAALLVGVLLLVGLIMGGLCGCRSPAVQVNKVYIVHQYGDRDNRVGVEVLKEQDISPQVKASVK
jgi:hypothetical protein